MACKLAGHCRCEMRRGADILSDGIAAGSVQVSADGQPIVMLADHQTTGGYAKIATVISADSARAGAAAPRRRRVGLYLCVAVPGPCGPPGGRRPCGSG